MNADYLAHVVKRNGAWLITLNQNTFEHSVPDELCDCAGSLIVAKRLARRMVTEQSDQQATHLRWQQTAGHTWDLCGRYEPDNTPWTME